MEFKLYAPGKWPGVQLHDSEIDGTREYQGQLDSSGAYAVLVSQKPAASRENDSSKYDLVIALTDAATVGKPALSQAESDCLAAVADKVGIGQVSTISVEPDETSTKVLVKVPGAQAPWQCNWGYRDGKPAVLETFYADEG